MKLVAYSFTNSGSEIGNKLEEMKYIDILHIKNKEVSGGVKAHLGLAYKDYDGIIFISATGIAIRLILPFIKDKHKDLPIIVIDDMGKFCISLLSGHVGGANSIAEDIANFIGAVPVITTASDNRGFEAIDTFAKENNYYIENKKDLTEIMAMMVNGKRIGLLTKDKIKIDYPNIEQIKNIDLFKNEKKLKDVEGLVLIERDIEDIPTNLPYIQLKNKDINIGVGCKKGIETSRIIDAILETMKTLGFSIDRIKSMGTVEVKKHEKGIIEAARHFGCPLKIYSIEEIKKIEDKFEKSDFVKKTIGVYSVSEPSAYLLGGELLVKKSRHKGITISISKE